MDKIRKMGILLLVCLYLSGCGSPDKNQQGEVQHVEAAQDKRQGTRAGRQAEDAAVQQGGHRLPRQVGRGGKNTGRADPQRKIARMGIRWNF